MWLKNDDSGVHRENELVKYTKWEQECRMLEFGHLEVGSLLIMTNSNV